MDTLKLKKAWEVALGPVKGLPMTFIMMYMSGNSLQIFSIMMVFMAFKNPLVGLVNTNQAFERFQTETNASKILQTKLVYVVMQIVALGVGIWKINGMGLLPYVLTCRVCEPLLTLFSEQHDQIGLCGKLKGSLRSLQFPLYEFKLKEMILILPYHPLDV